MREAKTSKGTEMWSLPNIVRLNDEAAQAAQQKQFEKEAAHAEEHNCEVCGWDGKEQSATYSYCWFDIYSDDAKGVVHLCEKHDGYTGSPLEGYFTCGDCDRVFIENYTWERFDVIVDECEQLCLPCALKRYLNDDTNWLRTDSVTSVVLDPDADELFDPDSGVLNLARAPHLIGVRMPVPDSITFIENLEFDSCTGQMLASTSSTFPAGVGESAALGVVRELAEQGHEKFLVILDAAYQFSVSISAYVDTAEHERILAGEEAEIQAAGRVVLEAGAL